MKNRMGGYGVGGDRMGVGVWGRWGTEWGGYGVGGGQNGGGYGVGGGQNGGRGMG